MEERRRDFIATIFPKRDVHDICKGEAIEHCGDGVSHVEHQHSQAAMRLIWAGAARVRGSANTSDWRERSVDQSDNGTEFYSPHGACERIAPKLSAPCFDVSRGLELGKNLLQKFNWQFFFGGQLTYLEHGPAEF